MLEGSAIQRAEQLKDRTKQFALRIIRLFQRLPKTDEARIVARQVLRSGTSLAANYRAVCRARPRKEFISKLAIVVEESDETAFWLELLMESGLVAGRLLEPLHSEASQLLAIFAASHRTARTKSRLPINDSMTQ